MTRSPLILFVSLLLLGCSDSALGPADELTFTSRLADHSTKVVFSAQADSLTIERLGKSVAKGTATSDERNRYFAARRRMDFRQVLENGPTSTASEGRDIVDGQSSKLAGDEWPYELVILRGPDLAERFVVPIQIRPEWVDEILAGDLETTFAFDATTEAGKPWMQVRGTIPEFPPLVRELTAYFSGLGRPASTAGKLSAGDPLPFCHIVNGELILCGVEVLCTEDWDDCPTGDPPPMLPADIPDGDTPDLGGVPPGPGGPGGGDDGDAPITTTNDEPGSVSLDPYAQVMASADAGGVEAAAAGGVMSARQGWVEDVEVLMNWEVLPVRGVAGPGATIGATVAGTGMSVTLPGTDWYPQTSIKNPAPIEVADHGLWSLALNNTCEGAKAWWFRAGTQAFLTYNRTGADGSTITIQDAASAGSNSGGVPCD